MKGPRTKTSLHFPPHLLRPRPGPCLVPQLPAHYLPLHSDPSSPFLHVNMTTTTMHFGPEWMRTKQPPARTAPSPPLAAPPPPTAPASSYSALVAPTAPPAPEKHDLSRPFKFSKEDLLRIYKEGGGRGGLGLEVERWEGIVREVGSDPVGLKDMSEGEKKVPSLSSLLWGTPSCSS